MKVGISDTIVAAEYKSKTVGATLVLFFYLLGVAGFTYLVLKKTTKKSVTISYTVMLLVALIIFGAIAYIGPKVRGNKLKICNY